MVLFLFSRKQEIYLSSITGELPPPLSDVRSQARPTACPFINRPCLPHPRIPVYPALLFTPTRLVAGIFHQRPRSAAGPELPALPLRRDGSGDSGRATALSALISRCSILPQHAYHPPAHEQRGLQLHLPVACACLDILVAGTSQ